MSQVIVRYRVRPDQGATNQELVRAVHENLLRAQPAGMRYATFQLDDGVSFVHLHLDENTDGSNALAELPAFKQFQRGIADRCEDGPIVAKVRQIGSYRLLNGSH